MLAKPSPLNINLGSDRFSMFNKKAGHPQRSFRLPDTIDDEKIKADFEKGVLHIIAPKRPEATAAEKKIPIGKG